MPRSRIDSAVRPGRRGLRGVGDQLSQTPSAHVRIDRGHAVAQELKHGERAPHPRDMLRMSLLQGGGEDANNLGLGRRQAGPVNTISFAIPHHAVPWIRPQIAPPSWASTTCDANSRSAFAASG